MSHMIPFQNTYARLPKQFFSEVVPARVPNASLIMVNAELAQELGIDPKWLESDEGVAVLAGNARAEGSEPISQVYAGHQFGGWSPQLGDGRAILLGEVISKAGERRDIQLKGAGLTPYSRRGDGRSALGPVIREYLMSEAMHALGVPTTRALAAVATGEKVVREEVLSGGVFTRVASSHIRIGTFQYFAALGDYDSVQRLLDYSIERHYPQAAEAENPALAFLESVISVQVRLVAQWMSLGFIHGVMNTDNCAISGETIDYGPCAMMEEFHPHCVFSAIDRDGRYAWGNQPVMAHWNLTRLAEALLPHLSSDMDEAQRLAEVVLDRFSDEFATAYNRVFAEKLGVPEVGVSDFIRETLTLLANQSVDFTLFFRRLTQYACGQGEEALLSLFSDRGLCGKWLEQWSGLHSKALSGRMREVNPILIPRNHRVEQAIQAAYNGDYTVFERLRAAWKLPFLEDAQNVDLELPAAPSEKVYQTFCGT